MSRRLRFFAAILAILSFVASGLALSFHPCAQGGGMAMSEAAFAASPAHLQPDAVCLDHCTKRSARMAACKTQSGAALQPALASRVRLVITVARSTAAGMTPQRAPLPAQPPPFIRFAVLRI